MFECNKCGECCRHLDLSDIYKELDDGTGKCKYLIGNLCSIYAERPIYCRVEECYELFFKEQMSLNEYYELNKIYCKKLRRE